MRILLPLDNVGGGGIARFAAGLARALPEHLDAGDFLIVSGSPPSRLAGANVEVIPGDMSVRHPVRRVVQQQSALVAAARQADLVHMTDYRAPQLVSVPFVLTVHDVSFLDHPEWYPTHVAVYKRAMLWASLRKGPSAVVCVSGHSRDRLLAHHPGIHRRSLVRVIRSGLDAPGEVAPGAYSASTAGTAGYFLTVSAIEPRKNHLGLLDAFCLARREGFALRWKVAGAAQYGAGPIVDALREAEGVDVLSRVSEAELEHLYRNAAFVALPSFEEGFGYPPLEAMDRGIATICSTGSAFDETVAGAALQVPSGSTAQWASALLRLERDAGLRARVVEAGRERARQFRWGTAARSYVELFREILPDV
ncbi:MAG TPA: glycosyltransferase family 1 protein [Acidimicrobiales bacterium]|nr:glycosyltransferase family 1 protein [Acidimicrobiales bacterium]